MPRLMTIPDHDDRLIRPDGRVRSLKATLVASIFLVLCVGNCVAYDTENVVLDRSFVDPRINLLRKPFSAGQLDREIRKVLNSGSVAFIDGEAQSG